MKRTNNQYPGRPQDLGKPMMVLSLEIFPLDANLPSECSLCIHKGTDNTIHFHIISTQFFQQFDLYFIK